jgi:WD40 repeat protein
MPRPERPLDPTTGPAAVIAAELRRLRQRAGSPGYRELAEKAGYSAAALANAAGGRRIPSMAVTLAFVEACGGDTAAWERRWREAAAEWAALQSNGSNGSNGGSEDATVSPYRGLRSYDVDDHDRFFGRGRLVEQLVRLLRHQRLVAVFGVSGSGKSSLLRAGLVPTLGGDDQAVIMTPGLAPMTALHKAVATLPAGERQLLIVDQFEELFTLCLDPDERAIFVTELAALVESPTGPHVVIAVRADFYARCTEQPGLAELLAGANLPVGPLTDDELQEVVTQPARRAGLTVERALVTKVLADATGQVGALPLVSHALLETWRQRRSDVLTAAGYEAAGGIAGAVGRTAEAVYQEFDLAQRATAKQVLTRLVTLGQGVADTRRRVSTAELDFPDVDKVLHELAGARLIVLDEDAVEIAHEALIEAWPRLYGWLHADRERLRAHRQLTEAAEIWRKLDRDPDALYRGTRLSTWDVRDTDRLNPLERSFLDASQELAAREATARRRRRRLALTSLAAGVVALMVLTGVALLQARRADGERRLAVSRQLVVNSRDQSQVDQEVALLLAAKAYDTQPTEEAGAALRQAVADSRIRAVVPSGHRRAFGVAYSPDGRRLATTGEDGALRLWTLAGPDGIPARPRVLRAHDGDVWSPVFSRDGRWLAACGVDGTVTVWDLTAGTGPVVLRGHRGVVSNVAFSPDGRRLASTSGDGTVRVWDRDGLHEPLVLAVPATPLGVAFSPDGQYLAASGESGSVWLWDAAGRGEPRVLGGHEGAVKQVAFSPDGRRLASGGVDGVVRISYVGEDGPPLVLRANDGTVENVAFSPDGRRVVSSHSDGHNAIRIWSSTSAVDPVVLYGHDGAVWSTAFSPDGQRVASVSSDGTVRLWDAVPFGQTRVLSRHDGAAWSAARSRDGRRVASGGEDGSVLVRQTGAEGEHTVLRGHQGDVNAVAISPDGRRVATAGSDRTVRVWDADAGREVTTLRGHERGAMSVAISGDGRRVASASSDGTVRVWNTDGRDAPLVLRGHDGTVRAVALSPDGQKVASTGADGTVRIWNTTGDGQPVVIRDGPVGLIWCVAFSPDGRRLAVGGHDGLLHIWNSDGSGAPLVLAGSQGPVWSVAYSPDGRLLASSGGAGGVRIWQTATGRELVELRGYAASVEQVVFGAGAHELISAHDDGTVRLWRCDVCGPIADVRALADRHVTRPLNAGELTTFLG